MKYCIGCKHLDLMPGYEGAGGGTYTGPGTYFPPELLCKKGHWKPERFAGEESGLCIEGDISILDIEQAMAQAETCKDFKERS